MAYEPIIDRVVQIEPDGTVIRFIKANIDSTDPKPMFGIAVGSNVFERDTGKVYYFTNNKRWVVPDDYDSEEINGKIIEATDSWLEENVSQESGYVLDRTLSLENAAAPADLVGGLKTALNNIFSTFVPVTIRDGVQDIYIIDRNSLSYDDYRIRAARHNSSWYAYFSLQGYTKSADTWTNIDTIEISSENAPESPPNIESIVSNNNKFVLFVNWGKCYNSFAYSNEDFRIKYELINRSKNMSYVKPELFGAKGDGTYDDTKAWQSALNSGLNVIAEKGKTYKVKTLNVTKNITIDCNDANFICIQSQLFNCYGTVLTTLTGQTEYNANDVNYKILNNSYKNYTGYAMLKGTNNFDESRDNYKGGCVGFFEAGRLTVSYPIDISNNGNGIDILIINPITVEIKNIKSIVFSSDSQNSQIEILYGVNCKLYNINMNAGNAYVGIALNSCANCDCDRITSLRTYGTQGTVSYIIAFMNSSFCTVRNSYLFNCYWHAITTGSDYLNYKNTIKDSVLMCASGYAYADHENGVGTTILNCIIAGIVIGPLGIIENTIIKSIAASPKLCYIEIQPPTDSALCGVTIQNVYFEPDDACADIKNDQDIVTFYGCGILAHNNPQNANKTFYIDKISINNIYNTNNIIEGHFFFGFKELEKTDDSKERSYVIKTITFNNCNLTKDFTCKASNTDVTDKNYLNAEYNQLT